MTVMAACLALASLVGTLAGCTTRTVYVGAGAHSPHHARVASSPSPSLPPGVKDRSSPGTYTWTAQWGSAPPSQGLDLRYYMQHPEHRRAVLLPGSNAEPDDASPAVGAGDY
jgi:hypothetical protein